MYMYTVWGALIQVLATLALIQASVQTLSQPFFGWMTNTVLPV